MKTPWQRAYTYYPQEGSVRRMVYFAFKNRKYDLFSINGSSQ